MLTNEDMEFGLESSFMETKNESQSIVTEGRTHQGPPELSEKNRKDAIKIVAHNYVAKFPIEYFYNNNDKKHDRIIAQVEPGSGNKMKAVNDYMYEFVKELNKKQNKLIFVYKKHFLFANPAIKKESASENTVYKSQASNPPESTMENFMIPDFSGKYFIEDFSNINIINRYVSEGLSLKNAVFLLESRIAANPFLPMVIVHENCFKTKEEYEDFLMESFARALIDCNMNIDIAMESLSTLAVYSPYDVSKESIKATTEAVTRNRNEVNRAVHTVSKATDKASAKVSPYVESIKNVYDKLMGEEAVKEEIVKGGLQGWLLSWRRLFLKLITVWKTAGVVTMAGAAIGSIAGFPWSLIIAGVLLVGRMYFYLKTLKAMAGFTDDDRELGKKRILNELELELKICREKIDDARASGDTKARYNLLRIESKIENEIYRIRYDMSPEQFRGERSVIDKL